jgi:ADP-heptose:LPS heptosyltransferase
MNIIFQINGGLGKSVMGTAVCKSIKEKYPDSKLIVITAYPDVFLNNPNVDRCLAHQELRYFYQDYIKDGDFLYLGQEPYLENSYIKQEKHLIETWCNLYDLPVTQLHGDIHLTKREIDFYSRKYQFDKPIIVLQTSGAAGELIYNWTRDIPPVLVRSIVDRYKDQYTILHVKKDNQISHENTIAFTDNIRAVAVMIAFSHKQILMDSSCQHIAAALGKSSNVLWVTTSPNVFGYSTHNNILAEPETKVVSLPNAVLTKYELVGNFSEFPYNDESEIFNEKKVITSII